MAESSHHAPTGEQEVGPCERGCGWLVDTDECREAHANEQVCIDPADQRVVDLMQALMDSVEAARRDRRAQR